MSTKSTLILRCYFHSAAARHIPDSGDSHMPQRVCVSQMHTILASCV